MYIIKLDNDETDMMTVARQASVGSGASDMGKCDPAQNARFLSETCMLEGDNFGDIVVRLQEARGMDEQHLFNSALDSQEYRVVQSTRRGSDGVSTPLKAVHSVVTENMDVFAPSCSRSSRWPLRWKGLCRKAFLMDLVQLLNCLEVKDSWKRWSVVFGCLGTGMVALSAVLSGIAALADDHGVMREQAEIKGAKDLSSHLTSEIAAEDHSICKRKRKSRAKAKKRGSAADTMRGHKTHLVT